jgi:ubiquitin-like 1-activating enzyme E1 B
MNENLNLFSDYASVIEESKVLVIGSGGIGCELLKSLVMSGFKNIVLIDLDQIEKSNLNRQFLFGKGDIGKNKSDIAKQNILKYRPNEGLNIEAHVGNIKDSKNFGIDFFSQFNIVMNALDNVDARTHVNRMCYLLNIPLVNSGSEGYLGNVQTSLKNLTPCYNCIVKNNTKSIPICTLRSRPEKIEHCVAWAKNLFETLYTNNESSSFLLDEKLSENNRENLNKFFYLNLVDEQKMNDKIRPINLEVMETSNDKSYNEFNEEIHKYDNEKFDLEFYIFVLFGSDKNMLNRIEHKGKYEKFDKENNDIINFIFAATNLRAYSFYIELNTRFKIKEIAGNIVPAIASTNAIVASLQTIEAIKVLANRKEILKNLHYNKTKEIKSTTAIKEMKNEECIVCSKRENYVYLKMNPEYYNLRKFVEFICKQELKVKSPILWLDKDIIYDENDEEQDCLEKCVSEWLNHNSILKVCDEDSDKIYKIIFKEEKNYNDNQFDLEFKYDEYTMNNNEEVTQEKEKSNDIVSSQNERPINDGVIELFDNENNIDICDEDEVSLVLNEESCLGKKRKNNTEIEDFRKK